jgi:hypothetical protein
MNDPGDDYNEFAIGLGKANLYAFLLNIPIIVVLFLFFKVMWRSDLISYGISIGVAQFLFVLLGGVIVHELLHGCTWAFFSSEGLKSIRFGFKWRYLTPYCHCKKSLKAVHYKIGVLMPLALTGIIPLIYAISAGNEIIFFYGVLFTALASGDIIVLFFLSRINNTCLILDHPTKMGFYYKCMEKSI